MTYIHTDNGDTLTILRSPVFFKQIYKFFLLFIINLKYLYGGYKKTSIRNLSFQ